MGRTFSKLFCADTGLCWYDIDWGLHVVKDWSKSDIMELNRVMNNDSKGTDQVIRKFPLVLPQYISHCLWYSQLLRLMNRALCVTG